MLLPDLLIEAAERSADKLAAVFPSGQATFSWLERQSRGVAAGLNRLGIGPGARVAILCDNTLAGLVYYWGILRSGAVTVDLPTNASQATVEAALEESRPRALAVEPHHLERILAEGWRACPDVLLSSAEAPAASGRSLHTLAEIAADADAEARLPRPDASSVAMIIYTSGTTGRAKGVMLSHENLLSNVASWNARLGLTEQDSLLLVAPLNYIHGRIQLLTYTKVRGTIFFSAGFRFPQRVLQELARHAATGFSGMPYHFSTLLRSSKLKRRRSPTSGT